ncbi:phosphoglucosamine mutase [bacterium]|nr:phosphoglucosamine mutase [bacterium]RQV96316.1 MAG: phosphoglucosamine mutase [bacterium]
MSKPVMISVSGIRGIVGEGLTPQLIVRFSAGVGSTYGRGKVMVGRDSRESGEMVKAAVFSGLMSVGCHPVDLGVCPTPTVQMAVQQSDALGGIVITASHNPVEWNALKLLGPDGLFLNQEEGNRVKQIVEEETFPFVVWNQIGRVSTYAHAIDDHIGAILELPYLDVPKIRQRRFQVAFDCVNGAGGTILPKLLNTLGCVTYPFNEEPTGRFAHTPEPVSANLKDLCRCVVGSKADIGFAVDPDVDRLAIVAENGEPLGEEYTVTLCTKFILQKKKGKVVVNMSTTRAVEDVTVQAGGELIRTPVGEIHVAEKMREAHAVIGGEGNGGVILPEMHLGRDAPVAIALTLQYLLEYGKPVSMIWKSLPRYVMTKKKIDIGTSDPDQIIRSMETKYRSEKTNLADGLKIDRADSWIHVRKSNTEPIIRVITEARTKEDSEKLCEVFIQEIKQFTGKA